MRVLPARLLAPALALMLLVACTGGGNGTPSSSPNPAAGGTLTLGMDGTTYTLFDPQGEWTYSTWEVFRCCLLRTLMSYDGTAGVTGTEPKPDLAAGPPEVSTDGLTWTFHLRPGLHYGPPLQGVPITSHDIVRAILRAGDPATAFVGLGSTYLSDIQGYSQYAAGKSDSVSGLETPDPLTLRIRENRPDSALPYDFTLATTAPIPPSPADPSAPYGVATGHNRSADPSKTDGYGMFLVSSGPYMIQGEGAVDFSKPAAEQTPASGLVPWKYDANSQTTSYGSLTLVRNPSWSQATDPLRLALADKIVIRGGPADSLFRDFAAGTVDMVFDDTPPPPMLHRYLNDASLRSFVQTLDTDNVVIADFNIAQPPFDDLAVRRAVAYALDRRAMLGPIRGAYGFGGTVIANHYVSDATEESLASGWNPFPSQAGAPDLQAARREMSRSRYAKGGRCVNPVCHGVTVVVHQNLGPVAGQIARSLATLGIEANVQVPDDFYGACHDAAVHEGLCVGDAWFPDYPSAGNGLIAFFAGPSSGGIDNLSRLGWSPADLAKEGATVRGVPSVDPQIVACIEQTGAAGVGCWTRLDQYLVTQVMPAVPLAFAQNLRITSSKIAGFSWDQGCEMPAIDRLAVAGA
jgi:peptide/nickel transport system substrate-binding protein